MESKPKKKKRMGCLVIVIAIIAILAGVGLASSFDSATKVSTSTGTLTKENFEKIQTGMTYEEVTKIIGGEGEVEVESGTKGEATYTISYRYNGKGSLGANGSLMFQGGKLVTKAQTGLE